MDHPANTDFVFDATLLAERDYWIEQLSGNIPRCAPPTDYKASVQSSRVLASVPLRLAPAQLEKLDGLTKGSSFLIYAVLMTALKICLYRYTQDGRIIVGSPALRTAGLEVEPNAVAIVDELSNSSSFRQLLKDVRQSLLDAYARQNYPLRRLTRDLGPSLTTGRSSLFDVAILMEEIHTELPEVGNDLTIKIGCVRDGDGEIEYNTAVFGQATIQRFRDHFLNVLDAGLSDHDRNIDELEMLGASERHRLVTGWNSSERSYPRDACVHEVFERQVKETPHAVALVLPATDEGRTEDQHVTYLDLDRRADRIASDLAALKIGPEALVGILMERSVEMVVAILGVSKCGGAFVPLDPSYPKERLAFMIEDSGVSILLTQEGGSEAYAIPDSATGANGLGKPTPRVMELDASSGYLAQQHRYLSANEISRENLAYVIYTSGSTGRPKGAMNTHGGIHNRLAWMQEAYQLTTTDRVLQKTPFSFDVSVWEFFWPLLNGACLVMTPPELHRDSAYLTELIAAEEITTLHFVPSMLRMFVREKDIERCRSLKRVISSGEALSVDLQERFFECSPAGLYNLYGPTEAAIDVTVWECERESDRNIVPIGRPIANTRIYLQDRGGRHVPVHVAGELLIAGEGVARGYVHRPELTAEKFVPDPFGNGAGERLYRTGDLARYRFDGNLEFLGRIDHQVKLRGFRIELEEIDLALRQHPAVKDVVVVMRGWENAESQRLVAYVVFAEENPPQASELSGFLRATLPPYMVPSVYVALDSIPLTPSGKVDRRALPESAPTPGDPADRYLAPQTLAEARLANIWAEVLGVEQVGLHDSFFDSGGHSLLGLQLVSRVRVAFGVALPLRAVFEAPTVAGLAARIERERKFRTTSELVRRGTDGELPLSYAQEGLWFLDQLMPGSAVYNIPSVFSITGTLDIGVLRMCLNEVVRRHDSLRTTFATREGRAVQCIGRSPDVLLMVVDLEGIDEGEGEARRVAMAEVARPFDLERGPLLRAGLVRLQAEEHVAFLCMHHIISDGWSVGVLIRELTVLYGAFSKREPSPLPELPVQYGDYALWQREQLQGGLLEQQLQYWRQQLEGVPELLELAPTGRPRTAVNRHRGGRELVRVPREVTDGLLDLARQEGCTLFMVILAAFQVLLYRYSGQEDIVVGSPVARRDRVELEGLIGFFVNTLVLRGDLSGNPTFREYLGRMREMTLGALEHQELPFERLVEEVQPRRDLGHSPVFQVMLVLQNVPADVVELPGLTFRALGQETGTEKFDLTLTLSEAGTGLVGSLGYNANLFDQSTIAAMVQHLTITLEGILSAPDGRVSCLPLFSDAQRQKFLVELNDTRRELPQDDLIQLSFEAQAALTPGAVAVVCPSTSTGEVEQLSYGELNRRANQLACYLRELGVGPENFVGICVERSAEMVVAIIAVFKAGGAYVPLDPAYPVERLTVMIEDSDLKVLLTQTRLQEVSDVRTAAGSRDITTVCIDEHWPIIALQSSDNPAALTRGKNIAYMIYTSGSGGRPKGVLVEHRQLSNYVRGIRRTLGLTPGRSYAMLQPPSVDACITVLFPPLLSGGSLHVIPPESALDAQVLADYFRDHPVDVLKIAPSHFLALQSAAPGERVLPKRWLVFGGEASRWDWVREVQKADPFLTIHNHYGPTETTVGMLTCRVDADADDLSVLVPLGSPLPNTRCYVLDVHGQPAPIGAAGELYIGGQCVARGYGCKPALTAERFLPDLYAGEPGGRSYRSGDRARYLADRNIGFLGRLDRQLKIRGFRVEPGEVETLLLEHPAVREVAVVSRPAPSMPGVQRLMAYIVPGEGGAPDVSELRTWAARKLPEPMIPQAFVLLERLPRAMQGKLDVSGLPEPQDRKAQVVTPGPATPMEWLLTEIWAQVLGVGQVSVDDNFFDLGGDSIIAIQIISRVRQAGARLTVMQLFQHQTIAELAPVVALDSGAVADQGPVVGATLLTPVQHRFFEQEPVEPHHWNQAVLVETVRPLEPTIIERAVGECELHHDVLRSRFVHDGSTWCQHVIERCSNTTFSVIDLSALPGELQSSEIANEATAVQKSLDLSHGPIWRVVLFVLGVSQADRLLITIHHLVTDGVSWRILLEDLRNSYEQMTAGRRAILPLKTTSFQLWAKRLKAHAQSAALRKEFPHWCEQRQHTPLPVDFPDGLDSNTHGSAQSVNVSLDESRTTILLRDVPRVYGTRINDVLLAPLVQAIGRWTGSQRVLLDLEGHGREELFQDIDLSRTMGWFTIVYPVLLDLEGTSGIREALRTTRAQLGGIPQNGVGYGLLRYLSEDESIREKLAQAPRAQLCFNYLGQFDSMLSEAGHFGVAGESPGILMSPGTPRNYLLEVDGTIGNGQLRLSCTYSPNLHERSTIDAFMQNYLEALEAIIAGCQLRKARDDTPYGLNEFPLSFAQERLWFLDQLAPGSAAYVTPSLFRIAGSLNIAVLRSSLREVVLRHETLRTAFGVRDGRAVQRIAASSDVPLGLVDLRGLGEVDRQREARRIVVAEASRPFDLERGPLLRAGVLRIRDEEHVGFFCMHHIISDAWSMGVLIQELATLYQAFSEGQPSPLPELPIQYRDYAVTQREHLQGEVLEEQLSYWRNQLADLPAVLELPTDGLRGELESHRGGRQSLSASREVSEGLLDLGRRQGSTLFMVLLAAFQTLLSRYTGQQDIVVGSPIAGRDRHEVEGLIGFFVNTLVLRGDLSGNPTFREFLGRVRMMTLGAYAHQDLPFEKLVEELQPRRDLRHSPLFQVMLNMAEFKRPEISVPGLTLTGIAPPALESKFALTLYAATSDAAIDFGLAYDADLFDGDTIQRMLDHFRILLEGIVSDPDQPVGSYSILSDAERRQLLGWNAVAAPRPENQSVHALFESQVERGPEAVALVFGAEQVSYAEVNRRANQLARHLRALGVGPEVRVGVLVPRSPDMIIAILATLKAGGAYVPLDVSYPVERLRFMLEDSGAAVLVTHTVVIDELFGGRSSSGSLPAGGSRCLTTVSLDTQWDSVAQNPSANLPPLTTDQNATYVIYTSGSTGRPKGVVGCHRGAVNYLAYISETYRLDAEDVSLQLASLSFDASVRDITGPLVTGARVVLVPDSIANDATALLEQVAEHAVTSLPSVVPTLLSAFMESASGPDRRYEAVRLILVSGEALHGSTVRNTKRLFPRASVVNQYGPTETTMTASYFPVTAPDGDGAVSLGTAIPNLQLYVLGHDLDLTPTGMSGELYVGGTGVTRGYAERAALTAERFLPDPYGEAGMRLYVTGDLGRYHPNGSLAFLGRADHQVKVRGIRIEPGEVESALAQHPAVRAAVVAARDTQHLIAYVVCAEEVVPGVDELRAFLTETLPEYMVPSFFVMLDALPLTPNGKVDRGALPEADTSRPALEQAYVAPRNLLEERLATIWRDVLDVEQVGIHDSFFDLGGHSLLATRLISRLRVEFRVDLPLRALFETPTIARLADCVEAGRMGSSTTKIVRHEAPGALPLSFAQRRLWFLDQLSTGSAVYNIPTVFRITGCLDVSVLQASLNEVVWRHESLRTTFGVHDGVAVQRVAAFREVPVGMVDLDGLGRAERESEARRVAMRQLARPFDLERGPLVRAGLVRLGEDEYVGFFCMHHIISDAWSMGVLIGELATLYRAFSEGLPSPLPELPIQYGDYAVWQREQLQGEFLEEQLLYWKEQLAGIPQFLELPPDRPRPAVETHRGSRQPVTLGQEVSEGLQGLARREGSTLFMVLLAAFQALLSRYSGEDDIVVGSPIAGRNRAEVEGLIGFFVNTLVLRGDLSGNPTFRELVGRVREMTLEAYTHQDLPFEQLVAELQPRRDLSRSPLFQVMMVLQNVPHEDVELPGVTFRALEREVSTAKFDLTLTLSETDSGVEGFLEYNTDLFDPATIERMAQHFGLLVAGIVADPNQRVLDLLLLTDKERQMLFVDWNDTGNGDFGARSIQALFEEQVEQRPEAVAAIFEDEQVSYRELNRRANQVAHFLRKAGVAPEVLVGICMEPSVEMIIALLGTLKAGGAYVPLDPSYPKERLQFMIQDSGLAVLLTHSVVAEASDKAWLRATDTGRANPTQILLDRHGSLIAREGIDNPRTTASGNSLAYLIYTSGSTGRPKGVQIPCGALANILQSMSDEPGIGAGDVLLAVSSLSFDIATLELLSPLTVGACTRLVSRGVAMDGKQLAERLREATLMQATVTTWQLLVESGWQGCALRVLCGGEVLPTDLAHQLRSRGDSLWNLYGPTETTIWSTCARIDSQVSIGRPIANTRIFLANDRSVPVPVGTAGELCIGGMGLARGYLGAPGLTAERFVPAFRGESGERLYRTGDRGRYLADGNIEFLGRADHQVKIRGFRIEPEEVEAVLRQYSGIKRAVVVVKEGRAAGDGGPGAESRVANPGSPRLVGYVVGESESVPAVGQLRSFLRARLPEYMVPSSFVILDEVPLTPNGKLDRAALPEPEATRLDIEEDYAAPRNSVEATLAQIWAEVLGVDRVGIHDNFFELGGESLVATRIASRVAEELHCGFSLEAFFSDPTIAGLASALEFPSAAGSPTEDALPQQEESPEVPPSLAVIEGRPLLSLISAEEVPPVDAAALTTMPSGWLETDLVTRGQIERWRAHLPILTRIQDLPMGRIAVIMLPWFATEIYSEPTKLVASINDGVDLAGLAGARIVSLTGLLPSATNYGRAVLETRLPGDGPAISTGHATTTATVVLAIERILREAGRRMEEERVGFLGLGSVGKATLDLMLRCLPHPRELLLCDVYDKRDSLERIREELTTLDFSGQVKLIRSRGEVPASFYDVSLIVGATNAPNILDIALCNPGTLIVDDSAPHCFPMEQAVRRFETRGDILLTEGGQLEAASPMGSLVYLPPEVEALLNEHDQTEVFSRYNPVLITGCVLSSLLSAKYEWLAPTVGLVRPAESMRHFQTLTQLGFTAASLRCRDFRLDADKVAEFRAQFGMT